MYGQIAVVFFFFFLIIIILLKKKEIPHTRRVYKKIKENRCLEQEEKVRRADMAREMEKTLLFEETSWR
jgi:hypothetical protein